MATATATKPELITPALHARVQEIGGPNGFLEEHNVERKTEILLLMLAWIASCDLMFLGEPGVGKTYLLELFAKFGIKDAKTYNHMIFKEMGLEELIGPRSIQAMKQDEIRRLTEGFLPDSNVAVVDEIFKGSASVLNALLDLFASRTLKVGGKAIDCKELVTILMASNELPTTDDLWPFRDRIGMSYVVEPVTSEDGMTRVIEIQLGQIKAGITPTVEPLTLEEITQVRAEADQIDMPKSVITQLVKAHKEWQEAKHGPSMRRVKSMEKVAKAHAWLHGRDVVTSDDLMPLQHMAWNHRDDIASARKVVMKFAGAFTKKVNTLKTKLDPIIAQMDELRAKHTEATDKQARRDLFNEMYDTNKSLKDLLDEATAVRDSGLKEGRDVSDIDTMIGQMQKAREFGKAVLTGDEP